MISKKENILKKPENCSRCKGLGDKPENLVNFLHNPIAPYFSSAYVTIISVVCGIALAAVFYMAVEQQAILKDKDDPIILAYEFIIVILSTGVIWHGYIKIIQYKAWPINLFDTLIPIWFSIVIVMLAVSVQDIRYFCLFFSALCLTGYLAYTNSLHQFKSKALSETYKNFYSSYGEEFHHCLLKNVITYIQNRRLFFVQTGAIFLLLSIIEFIFQKSHHDGLDSYILCLSMTFVAWYFFSYDLNSELKKIKCLSEYY